MGNHIIILSYIPALDRLIGRYVYLYIAILYNTDREIDYAIVKNRQALELDRKFV